MSITSAFYVGHYFINQAAKELSEGKSRLIKLDLIEMQRSSFVNAGKCRLSKNVLRELKEKENLVIDYHSNNNSRLINHTKILDKQLFYNADTARQISTLREV